MNYYIQKDTPVPAAPHSQFLKPRAKSALTLAAEDMQPVQKMEDGSLVGDSILCASKKEAHSLRAKLRGLKFKAIERAEYDGQGNITGWRVWKGDAYEPRIRIKRPE